MAGNTGVGRFVVLAGLGRVRRAGCAARTALGLGCIANVGICEQAVGRRAWQSGPGRRHERGGDERGQQFGDIISLQMAGLFSGCAYIGILDIHLGAGDCLPAVYKVSIDNNLVTGKMIKFVNRCLQLCTTTAKCRG